MAQDVQDGRSPVALNGRLHLPMTGTPVWPAFDQSLIAEIDLERARWAEITALTEMLTHGERLAPGYFVDPDWSAKDLIAHLGMWLTEAETQLINIAAKSYEPHEFDADRRNAAALAALKDQPWDIVWTRAGSGSGCSRRGSPSRADDAANRWVRKAGAEHYGEHLDRLRAWVAELIDLRTRPPVDERDSVDHARRPRVDRRTEIMIHFENTLEIARDPRVVYTYPADLSTRQNGTGRSRAPER
jgi:hypothetical protein